MDTAIIIHNGFRVYNTNPKDEENEDIEDGKLLIDLQIGTDIKINVLDKAIQLLPAISALASVVLSLF